MNFDKDLSIGEIILVIISLIIFFLLVSSFFGDSKNHIVSDKNILVQVDGDIPDENNEAVSVSDIESLQKFSDIVFSIDNKHFDEWSFLQVMLALTNTNVVLQAVEQGRKSMSDYKNQMDNVIVPQLSNKSITKQLSSIKNDFQTAYSASMYYFAFIAKMVSSNDMKEIDVAWAGSQTQIEEMLKYKKQAIAGLLLVGKYLQ